jgi:hypothetical protein
MIRVLCNLCGHQAKTHYEYKNKRGDYVMFVSASVIKKKSDINSLMGQSAKSGQVGEAHICNRCLTRIVNA